jgi:hypothetical protein
MILQHRRRRRGMSVTWRRLQLSRGASKPQSPREQIAIDGPRGGWHSVWSLDFFEFFTTLCDFEEGDRWRLRRAGGARTRGLVICRGAGWPIWRFFTQRREGAKMARWPDGGALASPLFGRAARVENSRATAAQLVIPSLQLIYDSAASRSFLGHFGFKGTCLVAGSRPSALPKGEGTKPDRFLRADVPTPA